MTVILPQHRLAYLAVPKVACTTIKAAFFKLENEVDFNDVDPAIRPFSVHEVYPTKLFRQVDKSAIKGFHKVALVRDPIDRFLSAYRNRVVEKNEIAKSKVVERIRELGLPVKPSLSTFISHLDEYRIVRGIDHHTRPMTNFLGRNPQWFSVLYDISRVDEFLGKISTLTGCRLAASVQNSSGKHRGTSDILSSSERLILEHLYAEDYEIYGDHFLRSRQGTE